MSNFKNIVIQPNELNMLVYAGQGDIGSIIAMQKLLELRNVIAFANFAINKAINEADNFIKFTLYRSAVLDYNSCYDYILQIIYFGFDFCSAVDSNESYVSQMKNNCRLSIVKEANSCRQLVNSDFKNKIEELKSSNPVAKDFFRQLKNFRSSLQKKDVNITEWANGIKHRGGFIVDELLDKKTMARIITTDQTGTELFDSANFLLTTTFDEIEARLKAQNKTIIEFLNYLQDAIFGNTDVIEDLDKSNKLFSANCYDKDSLKGNAYLTSFES